MKIRTQLLLGAALFGAVLLVIAASVAVTMAELDRIEGQATLTGRIVIATHDLDYLGNEYLLYGEPTQLDSWSGRYAALSADIANLSPASPEEQALVRAIADDQQRLQAVFDGIVAGTGNGSPPSADYGAFQVSWSRLGVQSQALESDASRLSAVLEDQADGLRFRNTLLVSALLGAFMLFLLVGFAVVGGRTLRSVNALQAGADAFGGGDLGHRIDVSSNDEVGDLARSFNRMAGDLATVTASRAELEAAQAELRSVALFPLQNPHPVLRADQGGRLLFSNPAGAALLGNLEVGERLPAPLCRAAREACGGGTQRTIEQDFGTTAYAIAVVPLPELGYVNLYFADVTERRRAEGALREREQTLQSVFRAAPVGIGIASHRVIGSANEHLCRMTGYAEDELLGQDARMLYLSDEAYALAGEEKSAQTLENGIGAVETQWRRKDGGVIDILLSSSPMDPSTPFENVVFVALDLTPLREKEAALRESEAKYRNAVELSPDAILIHQDGTIVFANPAAAALVGADGPDALVGRPILDLVHQGTRGLAAANIEQDLRGAQTPLTAIELLRDDGTTVSAQGRGAAIPFGGRPAVQVTLRDVTEEQRAEEALRAYAEDLRRSNEDLERYAYVSSHDLQEPLRNIVSFAQLLERRYKGRLDADADEYIEFIVEGGNRMQTLIQDLLAYSRVNSNPQERRPTDVEAVIAAVERYLDLQLRESGAMLTHDPMPTVTADPLQLEQVFANLVSNAIKFHRDDEPLRVHVGARRLDGFWEFSVKDNGIGIEAEYFDRIFVIFQRLHTKDRYPGTGIGLAIVKRIIDRHGGTIRVESTPGEGTTFYFTLPAA